MSSTGSQETAEYCLEHFCEFSDFINNSVLSSD